MLTARDFLGDWELHRVIDDRLAGGQGNFLGSAHFEDAGQGLLRYQESGELRLGASAAMTATREYRWHFHDTIVNVLFDDGRPFHRFTPSGQVAGTGHPCGDDMYTVCYDFTRWPDWKASWIVAGPRKDYTSISHYRQ